MAILSSRPSRSYAQVDHDPDGLSAVGSAPYGLKQQNGYKTYKPPLAETHLRRPGMYDSRPDSAFAPLPSAFNLSHKHRKEQVVAGQRAELEHILDPEYKSVSNYSMEDDASGAGSSRRHLRTAGGLGLGKGSSGGVLRSTASLGNFRPGNAGSSGSGAVPGAGGAGVSKKSSLGGVYMDSKGKIHDTEYDPFKGVSEMTRNKSRRRSAFGSEKRKGSDAESTSTEGSEAAAAEWERISSRSRSRLDQRSEGDGASGVSGGKDDDHRRRSDVERMGYAAARRKSIISQRSERDGGRATPSIRSNDDHRQQQNGGTGSIYAYELPIEKLNLGSNANGGRSRSSQGNYNAQAGHGPSPLSPTLSQPSTTSQTKSLPAIEDNEEMPVKSTEITRPSRPPPARTYSNSSNARPNMQTSGSGQGQMLPPPGVPKKEKVEMKAGTKKVTGFDAPTSPMPPTSATFSGGSTTATPSGTYTNPSFLEPGSLQVPLSARMSTSSRVSRNSSETSRSREPRAKPAPRAREDLFPETPAQAKRREEREKRAGSLAGMGDRYTPINQVRRSSRDSAAGGMVNPNPGYGYNHPHRSSGLKIDSQLAISASGKGRLLPEIEIVEDDDPRIVFHPEGKATRIQTKHDHVIRNVSGTSGNTGNLNLGQVEGGLERYDSRDNRSLSLQHTTGSGRDPSEIIDQGPGGYLPSRWAKGDKELRLTEGEKERYRPMEWGGKKGELGGRPAEWRPNTKEAVKKEWKDFQTNARFSLFRAKAKLGRKAEF